MSILSHIRHQIAPLYYSRFERIPDPHALYETYQANGRLSKEQLLEVQLSSLKSLLLHAYHHTRYYRRIFDDCGLDPSRFESVEQLNLLPCLTKEDVNENYSDLIADNVDEKERHVACTGGTSGAKMSFLRDNRCRAHRIAIQWRSDAWTGWEPGLNVAYVWPAAQDLSHRTTWKQKLARQYATGVFMINAGILSESMLPHIADELRRIEPVLIRCFPYAGAVVAKYLYDHHISLPGLKGVVSGGEPVFAEQREIMERGFGAPVYNLYASREVGTTAGECSRHSELHVAIDSQVVEIVNQDRQVPVGQSGSIVITDLLNYAMPLIRYAIGDFGSLVESGCSCGLAFPLLKNVVGRVGDVFRDCDGKTFAPAVFAAVLCPLGEDHAEKRGQLQVFQSSFREIVIRHGGNLVLDPATRESYTADLKALMQGLESVRFESVDVIPNEPSGKYRFTICNIPPDMPAPGSG